jgi:hypothetical protein
MTPTAPCKMSSSEVGGLEGGAVKGAFVLAGTENGLQHWVIDDKSHRGVVGSVCPWNRESAPTARHAVAVPRILYQNYQPRSELSMRVVVLQNAASSLPHPP